MATYNIAIDFDSSKTNIYMLGQGLVLSEPTVAAVSTNGKMTIKAVGNDAGKLIGKTVDNTKIVFPVFEGEIANKEVACGILTEFLRKIEIKSKLASVFAVMSVPCGATQDMLNKYEEVAKEVGISKVAFVESPILCAFGQQIALTESSPCFMIDIAGGTTSIAVLTLDGIISGVSVNFGTYKICTDIIDYVAEMYGLQIGLQTAERLKNEICSVNEDDALAMVINGRDISSGVPKSLSIRAMDIAPTVKNFYENIIEIAMSVLIKLPPEVSAEIRRIGICIAGEGANTYGLEKYFSERFSMPVKIADHADMVCALGGGVVLGNHTLLNKVCIKK